MRILISLAVHEQVEVVKDQLQNLLHFVQDPVIVLHVSRDFDVQPEQFTIPDRVLVNPERLATAWGTGILARAHSLNVRYALNHVECDYVAFHASNDLFVQTGVEAYMAGHAAGQDALKVSRWHWKTACGRDWPLRKFLQLHSLEVPSRGQIEGSFYRVDVFKRMLSHLNTLEKNVCWQYLSNTSESNVSMLLAFWNPHYPREEVYFSTALAACGVRPTAKPYTYMNWGSRLALTREDVDTIRRGNYQALRLIKPYEGEQFYSAKTVPRIMTDPLRQYIRDFQDRNSGTGRE